RSFCKVTGASSDGKLICGFTEISATARRRAIKAADGPRRARPIITWCDGLALSNSRFLCEFPHMRKAIYPGSFDPVTNGHLDVIERARKLFDEVIVAVAHNDEKQPFFSLEERLDLLRETAGKIDSVRIAQFKGLLVDFARAEK